MKNNIIFYLQKYKILVALLGTFFLLTLMVNRIPYVNLYSKELLLFYTLCIWGVVIYLYKPTFRTTLYIMFGLFFLSFILNVVHMVYYTEIIGNFIFVVLLYSFIREYIKNEST